MANILSECCEIITCSCSACGHIMHSTKSSSNVGYGLVTAAGSRDSNKQSIMG